MIVACLGNNVDGGTSSSAQFRRCETMVLLIVSKVYRSEDGPLVVLSSVKPGRNRASAILGERNGDGYGFSGCVRPSHVVSSLALFAHRTPSSPHHTRVPDRIIVYFKLKSSCTSVLLLQELPRLGVFLIFELETVSQRF